MRMRLWIMLLVLAGLASVPSAAGAMAPVTNIGSATPINSNGSNIGKDLRKKILTATEKKVKVLADSHGRNGDAAVLTVSEAANYTAAEALKKNLVDYVSPSLPALLNTVDG